MKETRTLGKEVVMSPSLDIEIRAKLASYLVDEISLEEFEDWFIAASWNVMHRESKITIDLVYDIELLLAEYSKDCWNEDELREQFLPIVQEYRVDIGYNHFIAIDSIAKVDRYPLLSASFGI
jgi:hypothetical protein